MKYYDGQAARKGDTCVAGTWGTCRIIKIESKMARLVNVMTKEKWDLDDLNNFDLIDRKVKN